jgi:hypothetical protein
MGTTARDDFLFVVLEDEHSPSFGSKVFEYQCVWVSRCLFLVVCKLGEAQSRMNTFFGVVGWYWCGSCLSLSLCACRLRVRSAIGSLGVFRGGKLDPTSREVNLELSVSCYRFSVPPKMED